MIRAEGVRYVYSDGTLALRGVNFRAERGEKVAIVGRNGSGKTTLLLCLCGLLKAEGRIEIDGVSVRDERRIRRIVGMVFQNADDQVFSSTVFDDVAFGPRNLRLDDVEGRVEWALRLLGIEHLKEKNPANLSGGEKKKVAIAGVIAMDPKVLLVDEPTAGLDHEGIHEIFNVLEELSEMGKTVVVATHDLDFALSWADRIVLMDRGEIVAEGDEIKAFGYLKMPTKERIKSMLGISRLSDLFEGKGRVKVVRGEADYCYGIVDFSKVRNVDFDMEIVLAESFLREIRIAVSDRMKRKFRELAELYGVEVYEGDEG